MKSEKIGLIQIDGKMPNLALMKMSSFYKQKGFDVTFIDLSTMGIKKWIASKIFVGGSGYDLKADLPKEIEELTPDYEGFKLNYSLGFTTRGCVRNCDFCIVREKEGILKEVNMNWIKHTKAILIDNNFLASSIWKEKLQYFIDNNIKICIIQAMDIRLITEENAKMLLKVKSYDRKFKTKGYYFAFDDPKLEPIIRKKIEFLIKLGFNPKWLMFYVLVGYNTTHEEDLKRAEILMEYGCKPYIMKFNDRTDDKWLNHFDRWINRKCYEFIPLEEYKEGVLSESNKKCLPVPI